MFDEVDGIITGFVVVIAVALIIGLGGCDDDESGETDKPEVSLELVYEQNSQILNVLNQIPMQSTESQEITALKESITAQLAQHAEILASIQNGDYRNGGDKGVFTEADSSVRSVDDMAVVEFDYKGRKYARFSLEGAGRGFAIPLDCGDPAVVKDSTGAPIEQSGSSMPNAQAQFNFNFSQ